MNICKKYVIINVKVVIEKETKILQINQTENNFYNIKLYLVDKERINHLNELEEIESDINKSINKHNANENNYRKISVIDETTFYLFPEELFLMQNL